MRNARRSGRGLRGLVAAALLLSAAGLAAQEEDGSRYVIHLKSRTFTPSPGVEPGLREGIEKAGRGTVGLVQLDEVPDEATRAQLEKAGVVLLDYIPNNAWIARLPADLGRAAAVPGVRFLGRLLVEDKLAPGLARTLADKAGKPELTLDVEAFEGSLGEAVERVEALGGRVVERDEELSVLQAVLPRGAVRSLAASDAVRWVSPELPKVLHNNHSRAHARANPVQTTPYGLTGAGVQLGIWDGGEVFAHTDFGTRLTNIEFGEVVPGGTDHATHVAGTMAGDGTRSTVFGYPLRHFRGFATAAAIIGYNFGGTPYTKHNGAINTWGVDLSQNSWGARIRTVDGNCALYGDYEVYAREYDRIVTGIYGKRIPVVFSAGNERQDGDCGMSAVAPFVNYGIIPPPATAKDIVAVGAVNGDNGAMTTFSSWGPTDDGRLRPDLVGAGCNAGNNPVPAIGSTWPTNGYAGLCGTSMAAPAVSGTLGLMIQRYRAVCTNTTADPLPSTLKALLVHTARDLDDGSVFLNPGPDYASGYGAMDTKEAVDMLPFHREDQVSQSQVDTFQITVTRQSNLKVTLVWDDPAAAAGAGVALVNNLDLELVEPNGVTIHRPWVLNPVNPTANATKATDNRNVVEQVVVGTVTGANAGVWTIRVKGTSVPSGPQRYSLVSQHLKHADLSCHGNAGADGWVMDKDVPLSPVDPGTQPNPDTTGMWLSNQIWVRHNADGIMVHQNPELGSTPNYIYARVRNRGTATLNTARAMIYVATASTGLGYPQGWTLVGESTVANLAPGASTVITPVPWFPPATGHFCLFVRLVSDQDPMAFAEGPNHDANTRNNNNIAWRNVDVFDLVANSVGQGGLLIGNTTDGEAELAINFDMIPDGAGVSLFDLANVTVQLGDDLRQYLDEQEIELGYDGGFEQIDDLTFRMVGPTAFFTPIPVSGQREFGLTVTIEHKGGEACEPLYTLDINQNFAPMSGAKSERMPAYDPDDPNIGGVRYEVLVPYTGGMVHGYVTDADGAPLPGAAVMLVGSKTGTVTDANGNYELSVPGGTRSLAVSAPGFTDQEVDVDVPCGGEIQQDVVLSVAEE